jgi:anti-sigma28 factor (negative regulator of flagellin synthesis)
MQISDIEVKKILGSKQLISEIVEIGEARSTEEDHKLVKKITQDVIEMPDREDRIAELKAKIESGQYNVTGEEIADTMIRRAIADHVR